LSLFRKNAECGLPADCLLDVAGAFDLIEHVPSPRAFLRFCATVRIAFQTLSLDYLVNQIRPLNPIPSGTLSELMHLVPALVLRKYGRINIGEILAAGRRS
jgi:hypothetical protein